MIWANARACAPVWSGFSAHCDAKLGDCRIVGCAEDDLLLLEAVADRRAAVDAHGDRSDAESISTTPAMMPPISK
jgi:hypothetical protein